MWGHLNPQQRRGTKLDHYADTTADAVPRFAATYVESILLTSMDSGAQSQNKSAKEQFTAYYMQRATHEFAEDLDKIRNADDFKNDALPMLIRTLQQGTAMFSAEAQKRIVAATAEEHNGTSSTDGKDGTDGSNEGSTAR